MFYDRNLQDGPKFSKSGSNLGVIGDSADVARLVHDERNLHVQVQANLCDGLNMVISTHRVLRGVVIFADKIGGLLQAQRALRILEKEAPTLPKIVVSSAEPSQRFLRQMKRRHLHLFSDASKHEDIIRCLRPMERAGWA